MGEIKKIDEPERVSVHTRGGKPIEQTERKGTTIVGGSDAGSQGPLKILDKNSPVEPTQVDEHIHPDRKSFKEATEKDQ